MKNSLLNSTLDKLLKPTQLSQFNPTTLLHQLHKHQLMDNQKDMEQFLNNQFMIKILESPQQQDMEAPQHHKDMEAKLLKLMIKTKVTNNLKLLKAMEVNQDMIKTKTKVIIIIKTRVIEKLFKKK